MAYRNRIASHQLVFGEVLNDGSGIAVAEHVVGGSYPVPGFKY